MRSRFEVSIVGGGSNSTAERRPKSMLESGTWVLNKTPVLQQVMLNKSPEIRTTTLEKPLVFSQVSLEEVSVAGLITLGVSPAFELVTLEAAPIIEQVILDEPPIIETVTLAEAPVLGQLMPDSSKEQRLTSMDEVSTPEKSNPLKAVRKAVAVGAAALALSMLCVSDTAPKPGYVAPSGTIVNIEGVCPPNSSMTVLNMPGIGNEKIGEYAAGQEQNILGDSRGICYAGFSYGSEYDIPRNAAVLHDMIEKNGWKHVDIFAHSFGGIATIDMLNEYHRQHPESEVEFSIVFFSSPAELDDLWPDRKFSVEALSVIPLTQDLINAMTYLSIVGQGDKSLFDPQVYHDTNIASSNTPATNLGMEAVRMVFGMSRSDMNVPMKLVIDLKDKVVNTAKTIESIPRHTGQPLQGVLYITHTDHRMENHAALWWLPNNGDYTGTLEIIVDADIRHFVDKDLAKIIAMQVTQGGNVKFTAK